MPEKNEETKEVEQLDPIAAAIQRLALLRGVSYPKYSQKFNELKLQKAEVEEQYDLAEKDLSASSNRIGEMTNFLISLGISAEDIDARVDFTLRIMAAQPAPVEEPSKTTDDAAAKADDKK